MGVERAIDISDEQRETILALLERHLPGTAAWVYGSRTKWTSRPQSDLDLVVFATPEQRYRVGSLRDAFGESDLPFRVDLFVWDDVPEAFHEKIEAEHVELVPKPTAKAHADWRETRWGDIATLEYGRALRGYHSAQGPFCVFGTNGPIGWHDQALCEHASVIVGRKGAYRGIHYSADPFFVIDTAFYLRPKIELDARWAYYTLLTQDINGMDSGSAIPSTSRDEFYTLPVCVPPLPEQRAIAHILGTLDDKIELNRRVNETLEAMARALFKSWFVDFDPVRAKMEGRDPCLPKPLADLFPDCLVDSEIGEIPKGWEIFHLDQLAIHHTKSTTPSSYPDTEFEHFSIPAYDSGHVPAVEKGVAIKSNKTVMPSGGILLSKLNPEIPRVWMPDTSSCGLQICSTEFLVFTPRSLANRSMLFSLFTDGVFRSLLQSMVTGTSKSHQRVSPKALKQCQIVSGTPTLFSKLDQFAASMLNQVVEKRGESKNLAKLRDVLLPKLISGEIRLREAEKVVEAVA